MFPFLLEDTESQHEIGPRTVVKILNKLGTMLGLRRKAIQDWSLSSTIKMLFPNKEEL